MSKKQKAKMFFTRSVISALIASFVLGVTAGALVSDSQAAGKTKTSKTLKHSAPATDCASVKLRYYQALSKGVSPSATDLSLADQCAVKSKKTWAKNPSSKTCKTIKKYESQSKLTQMVKKKKMNWTGYFYCKATYWIKK